MKVKSLREKKDWKDTWVQTAVSAVALLGIILVGTGVITADQNAEAQPLISNLMGAISSGIIAVSALIGIFVKQDAPVE